MTRKGENPQSSHILALRVTLHIAGLTPPLWWGLSSNFMAMQF